MVDRACHATNSRELVDVICTGEQSCSIAATRAVFNFDADCNTTVSNGGGGAAGTGLQLQLAVGVRCEHDFTDFAADHYFNQWSSSSWPTARVTVRAE